MVRKNITKSDENQVYILMSIISTIMLIIARAAAKASDKWPKSPGCPSDPMLYTPPIEYFTETNRKIAITIPVIVHRMYLL